ncbi:MAG: hypothetical protein JJE47_09180 [Acidimicrobiia bacterium]|nr:hypothetical protein [Acidimicrobiia bacterium]
MFQPDPRTTTDLADVHTDPVRHVFVDVESTSRPVPGPKRHMFECDVDIRVSDGWDEKLYQTKLTIHHPRGWMGIEAGFAYNIDPREYPTFDERADIAYGRAVAALATDQLVSVAMLGTGKSIFVDEMSDPDED